MSRVSANDSWREKDMSFYLHEVTAVNKAIPWEPVAYAMLQ